MGKKDHKKRSRRPKNQKDKEKDKKGTVEVKGEDATEEKRSSSSPNSENY